MRLKRMILLSFIMILTLIPINMIAAETVVQDYTTCVTLDILDAYYFAAEDDGLENDIAGYFMLKVESNRQLPPRKLVVFYLLVSLTLPSGKQYSYLWEVTSSYNIEVYPTVYFYDHATESGWYLLEITCFLNLGPKTTAFGTESYYFDPPGGTEGTEPGECAIVL